MKVAEKATTNVVLVIVISELPLSGTLLNSKKPVTPSAQSSDIHHSFPAPTKKPNPKSVSPLYVLEPIVYSISTLVARIEEVK